MLSIMCSKWLDRPFTLRLCPLRRLVNMIKGYAGGTVIDWQPVVDTEECHPVRALSPCVMLNIMTLNILDLKDND